MKSVAFRMLAGPLLLLGIFLTVSRTSSAQTSSDKKDNEQDALVKEAEGLFGKGDIDGTAKKLDEAVKKNPLLPPARLMLARLMLGNQQTAQAGRQLLELGIAENPDHPEVYLTNGSLALAEGRITDTISNCQIALQLAEADRWTATQRKTFQKEAHAGLATAFEARKDWSAARKHFVGWVAIDSKNGQLRQRLARVLFMTGKHTDAYEELVAAFKDDDKLDPPEVSMALLFASIIGTEDPKKEKKDDFNKDAVDWFEKGIKKYTDKARAHQAYGGWLLDAGKLIEAKPLIASAQKLDGATLSRETKALLGLHERYNQNYASAEKYFEEIIRLAPGDFFSSNQLILVLIEQKDDSQKLRAVQQAEVNARAYPKSAEAIATLGWVYLKMGRLIEAERALAMATNSGQASADTAFYLAQLLFKREKYTEARDVLAKSLESKGVFVNRKQADEFMSVVKAKVPKEDPKKDVGSKEPAPK